MKGKYMNKLKGVLPKKRYIIGLKEVTKNLSMQRLTMVILSTNIENVEGEFGLD
jgi:ribosomal protein L7Ae-like RNA K-turn-binding protein